MVTKVGKELLGQLKRDRMVLLPLTDKIFGKTEVKDKGVAPSHHPFTDHMSFVFIGPESDHWQCLSVTHSLTN